MSVHTRKLSLWGAVLINANIVIGSAFFLGAPKISSKTGLLAPFMWLLCGLMLLPLVLVLAKLSKHYPSSGGIYVYSHRTLGQFWGFISGWGYFIGTAAGNAAVLHMFSKKVQKLDFIQHIVNPIGLDGIRLDIFLVVFFAILNMFNIDILERIQVGFTLIKVIPFLLILVAVPFLFKSQNIAVATLDWSGFFEVIPLVLFAYVGMEACCSIADKIEDGHKNASKTILISFGLIMLIYTVMQLSLLCIHGPYQKDPFMNILPMLTGNQFIINWGNSLIYLALLTSFLAGYYGMFYYNNWNLYTMAQEKSVLFHDQFLKLNKHQTPWMCILGQSFLVMVFLLITTKKTYLITMGDFGTTIAYLLSSFAYLSLYRNLIGFLSLLSCGVLIYICTNNLVVTGVGYIVPFMAIILLGILGYKLNKRLMKNN